MTNFTDLGLTPKLLESITNVGYETPTPIQEQAIPLVMDGHDVMGLAQTGTGKTAAFGLPLVHKLMEEGIRPKPKGVRALILAPTRELVNQISENLRQYVKKTPIWVNVVIGGQSINKQAQALQRGTDILVATPGRLLDLADRKALFLDTATFLVLDEADQMLDLGFIHSLRKISKMLGTPRQTMLFSATMPKAVEDLSKAFLNDPVRVQVAPPGKAADKIEQCVHHVSARDKTNLLKDCLIERRDDLSLVFARTKHGAEKLMKHLVDCGFKADSIHGNKSQGQRDRAIRAFKKRDIDILVATDVAARGIDVPGVSHVYNFNLPEVAENYVHRIGRTARAGAEGKAIAFCAPEEFHLLKQIEKLMSISIRIESGDEPEGMPAKKAASNNRSRGRNGKPAGSGGRRGAGHRGRRTEGRTDNRSENTGTGSAKPKKFKNKQVSVADYDAKEQRRKEGTNRQEHRNNSGENRFSNNKNGSSTKGSRHEGENAKRTNRRPNRNGAEASGQKAENGRSYENRNKAKPGQKPWKSKTASGNSKNKFKGQKSGDSRSFNKPNRNKRPAKRPQSA
ncbi:MAG: DEAD/DEAH box helicase [Rhizobiaceae bacterium]|nr:DEAD/DEAH box helicase [Rhizobiaceae bacterium]